MFQNRQLNALKGEIEAIKSVLQRIEADLGSIRQNQLSSASQVLAQAKTKKHDIQDLIDTFIETKMLKELELNGGQLSNQSDK